MDIEDMCRKLKPVLGRRIERLYQAYLSEERDSRSDIESAIRVLYAKTFGNGLDSKPTILPPPSRAAAQGIYPLAQVIYNEKSLYEFGLREDDWIQHVSIFGRTGAGKTNAALILIGNLLKKEKPFLIFDWKRNYRDLLATNLKSRIDVFTVGKDVAPFYFNPLIPPEGTPPKTWLKKLIEIIASALYCGEGVKYILMKAIDEVYRDSGVYSKQAPAQYPTMVDVYRYLEGYKASGREAQWMISTLRAVKSLCFGGIGQAINTPVQAGLAELLKRNVILELDSLSETDKVFLIDSLMLWIYHYRMAEGAREHFKHAIFVEEAHHMLKKEPGMATEKVIDVLLREIRELGESIILIDQTPSMIAPTALANTHTSIFMNLKTRADVNAAAACLLLENSEHDCLGELPVGCAVMKQQDRCARPFMVRFPRIEIKKGAVTDPIVAEHMKNRGYSGYSAAIQPADEDCAAIQDVPVEDRMDETSKMLIEDVAKYPLCGVVARYKRLGISRRKGTESKERMEKEGLISCQEISTDNGRTTLLELTKKGEKVLKTFGKAKPTLHKKESLEHRYWKKRAAEHYRQIGYRVIEEEDARGTGPDIILVKGEESVAVEIETGKADPGRNMERNLGTGYVGIIVLATGTEAMGKCEAAFESAASGCREAERRIRLALAAEEIRYIASSQHG